MSYRVRPEVGCECQQSTPLRERLADEPEPELFEIAQAAVDQAGRPRRGPRGDVVLLHQDGAHPARGGVEQGAGPDDPAADDDDIPRLASEGGDVRGSAVEGREGRRRLVSRRPDHASGEPGGRRAIRHSSQAVPTISTTMASGVWKTTS